LKKGHNRKKVTRGGKKGAKEEKFKEKWGIWDKIWKSWGKAVK